MNGFLGRLEALPIDGAEQDSACILELPSVAHAHDLTNYDAAYMQLAIESKLPLATNDNLLRRASSAAGVRIFAA